MSLCDVKNVQFLIAWDFAGKLTGSTIFRKTAQAKGENFENFQVYANIER